MLSHSIVFLEPHDVFMFHLFCYHGHGIVIGGNELALSPFQQLCFKSWIARGNKQIFPIP